jgi:hypothetical protein
VASDEIVAQSGITKDYEKLSTCSWGYCPRRELTGRSGATISNHDEHAGGRRPRGPLDRVLGLVPVNAVVEQVDVQAVLERVDINALLARVDIDALLARVDVNALVERVDVNGILDRVDVNALIERVDVEEIVARTEVGDIVVQSTTGLAERALDTLRAQFVRLDQWTNRVVNRLLRRRGADSPPGPARLVGRDAA